MSERYRSPSKKIINLKSNIIKKCTKCLIELNNENSYLKSKVYICKQCLSIKNKLKNKNIVKNCKKCKVELNENNYKINKKHTYICNDCKSKPKCTPKINFPNRNYKSIDIKKCIYCGIILTSENWYKCEEQYSHYQCIKCSTLRSRENFRKKRNLLRLEAIKEYGSKCACCGENRIEFLCINHIFENGAAHRREIGNKIYFWLKKHHYPKDSFNLLCYNCNSVSYQYGICPHQK